MDEEPDEAVSAAIVTFEAVRNDLDPERGAWSDCMVDAGFPAARMNVPESATAAQREASSQCQARSGYDARRVELMVDYTAQWASEHIELIDNLRQEMDLLVASVQSPDVG